MTITWDGAGDGQSWSDPANWTGGQVPGVSDDAVIDAASNPTITVSGNVTVHSLTSQDPFQIAGGSFTVLAPSQVNNSLTISPGASLTVSGIGASFTASGTTIIDGASLYALGSGQLTLPGVTSYTANGTESTLEATGTGSVLSLPNLTSVADNSYQDNIEAISGGTVNLPSLPGITANFYLAALSGGQVTAPDLTTLAGVTLALDSAAGLTTSQIISMTRCAINVSGASLSFDGLTDIDASSVTASGGAMLSFPGVTSYTANGTESTLEATGAGSVLSLPNLTSLADNSYQDNIEAISGGTVNLPSLAAITADFYLAALSGGQVAAPDLSTLAGVTLALDSAAGLTTSQIISLTSCAINVSGASLSFAGLTDIDASSVTASGGAMLSFPGVTSYTANGTESTLKATGAGSVLSLPNLTSLADNSYQDNIEAISGGTVNLPSLAAITANFYLAAQGTGAVLNIPVLTSFSGSAGLQATGGGQVAAPDLSTLAGVTLALDSAAGLTTSQIISLTSCAINVSGASLSFAGLTDIDASSVTASGGAMLSFPGVTSYTANGTESTLKATGAGSVLSLPNLTSLADNSYQDNIEAISGGTVNLPSLAAITANFYLAAQGTGAVLNIPVLTSFSGSAGLQATGGGQVAAPDLTTLAGVILTLDSATGMATSQITSLTSCAINVSGASLSFAGLTDIDASSVTASGGAMLSFPGVTSYTANGTESTLKATGAGSVLSLPNLTSLADNSYQDNIEAISGGTVNLPSLAAITADFYLAALSGGQVAAPDLSTLAGVTLALDSAAGLTTSQIISMTRCAINVSGASLSFAGLTDIDASSVTASGGAMLSFPGVTSYTANGTESTLEATGPSSVLSLPNLTSLADNSYQDNIEAVSGGTVNLPSLAAITADFYLAALSGGQTNLPVLTTIIGNDVAMHADGAKSVISAPELVYYSLTVLDNIHQTNGGVVLMPPVPDLVVSTVTAPATTVLGQTVTVSWTDVNQGTADASDGWVDRVYLYTSPAGANPTLVASVPFNGTLAGGKVANQSAAINIPLNLLGTFYFGVTTNYFQGASAQNTRIDSQGTQIVAPDLAVGTVQTTPATVQFGQQVSVSWKVTNQGNASATGDWADQLYLSTQPTLNSSSVVLATQDESSYSSLAIGDSYIQSTAVTLPVTSTMAAGTYYVVVVTNYDQSLAEASTTNNQASGPALHVTLPPLPELQTSGLSTATHNVFAGQTVTVSWMATNNGSATATGPWTDSVYLATDAQGDGQTLLGTFTNNTSLGARNFVRRKPTGCVAGRHGPVLAGRDHRLWRRGRRTE